MDINKNAEVVRAQFGGRDPLFGAGGKLPKLVELRLETIRLNPDQPRKTFDDETLAELASSIEQHGLLQPITVKRIPGEDEYLLVAGERRYRAVQKLTRPTITAIITDGNADELAVIENLQREDLRPLEQAEALARLQEAHGYNQAQLAKVIGKGRTAINELLQLVTLPEEIRRESLTSDTPKAVLIEIVRVKNPEAQRALWEKVKNGGTVRAARATKKSDEVKDAQTFTTTTKALAAAKGLLRRLQELAPGELTANHDQYQELVRVKAEIDELMERKAGDPEA
jgi:ParB family transcriptional regulator, chromosome partitioning protein